MARKSLNAEAHEGVSARDAGVVAPADLFSAAAPLVATWCTSSARLIALVQHAELARAEALARLATSMRDIGVLAGEAKNTEDLGALASRLQQAWMELGSTRQADITRAWAEAQDEAARQLQALSDRNASPVAGGRVDAGTLTSSIAVLMEQARVSMEQWTRDWTAIVKTPGVVQ